MPGSGPCGVAGCIRPARPSPGRGKRLVGRRVHHRAGPPSVPRDDWGDGAGHSPAALLCAALALDPTGGGWGVRRSIPIGGLRGPHRGCSGGCRPPAGRTRRPTPCPLASGPLPFSHLVVPGNPDVCPGGPWDRPLRALCAAGRMETGLLPDMGRVGAEQLHRPLLGLPGPLRLDPPEPQPAVGHPPGALGRDGCSPTGRSRS
jgi:hypothetical protein